MDERDRSRLQRKLTALTNDLFPSELYPYLSQEGVLNDNDVQLIKAEATQRQQAYLLVTTLFHKGSKAYGAFVESLKDTHRHLYDMLMDTDDQSSNESG